MKRNKYGVDTDAIEEGDIIRVEWDTPVAVTRVVDHTFDCRYVENDYITTIHMEDVCAHWTLVKEDPKEHKATHESLADTFDD